MGYVTSVGTMGIDHAASCERSYWNNPHTYSDITELENDWADFYAQSLSKGRRRAQLRTFVTAQMLNSVLQLFPVEAVIPLGSRFLVYIGLNQHHQLSVVDGAISEEKCSARDVMLPAEFDFSVSVHERDTDVLTTLWQQFGWSQEGVEQFIAQPHAIISAIRERNSRELAGVMIAEHLRLGDYDLVELTELAVQPVHQGRGLAAALIHLTALQVYQQYPPNALTYGEFNLTNGACAAARKAGMQPGRFGTAVDGILRDHVSITTGPGNPILRPWDTQWLHSFQVMWSQNLKK